MWSLFWSSRVPIVLDLRLLQMDAFSRGRPEGGRAVFITFEISVAIMVLIDSACRELSIGCHIVFWSNFEFQFAADSGRAGRKVTPFLTGSIGKKSSNQAHYKSNRLSLMRAFQNTTHRPHCPRRRQDIVSAIVLL